jgi:hypothetical protein
VEKVEGESLFKYEHEYYRFTEHEKEKGTYSEVSINLHKLFAYNLLTPFSYFSLDYNMA